MLLLLLFSPPDSCNGNAFVLISSPPPPPFSLLILEGNWLCILLRTHTPTPITLLVFHAMQDGLFILDNSWVSPRSVGDGG